MSNHEIVICEPDSIPLRDADIYGARAGDLYEMRYWQAEDVIAFKNNGFRSNDEGWTHYKKITSGGVYTATQYIEKVLGNNEHPHHKVVINFTAERALLDE